MHMPKNETVEQLERIEVLLERLRTETARSREEARVVSESMADRARMNQGISAFKKKRAEVRKERIRPRNR